MARYVILKNENKIEPKYIVEDEKIIEEINTVEVFDTFRDLSYTQGEVEYEVYDIVSEQDYYSLWKMNNHNKHKEYLNEMVASRIEELKNGDDNICHACYIEISADGNLVYTGFANRPLFESIEEKYLGNNVKKLTKKKD